MAALGFTQIPNDLIEDARLSCQERLLWITLKRHDFASNQSHCRPSIPRLAHMLGITERSVYHGLRSLEEKGYLLRHNRPGRTSFYDLLVPPLNLGSPLNDVSGVGPCNAVHPCTQFQGTPEPSFTPPLNVGSEEEYFLKNTKEEYKDQPSAAPLAKTAKKVSQKKAPSQKPVQTKDDVMAAIESLDLAKFAGKYGAIDVPREHAKFTDHYLGKNDARSGKPLWMKWSDWNRAFHSWCRNAEQWQADSKLAGEPPPPAHRRLDLT